jgi:hypothetical protein
MREVSKFIRQEVTYEQGLIWNNELLKIDTLHHAFIYINYLYELARLNHGFY